MKIEPGTPKFEDQGSRARNPNLKGRWVGHWEDVMMAGAEEL